MNSINLKVADIGAIKDEEKDKELSLVICDEYIAFSKTSKEVWSDEDQFSLYDEYVKDFELAKNLLLSIGATGDYIPPSKK